MLAHVLDAETVQARIEGLELGRRFDAVLLASNLVTAEPAQRRAFLETCRRHADLVICEGLPLAWAPEDSETMLGDVLSRLHVESVEDGVVRGEMEYETAARRGGMPSRWSSSPTTGSSGPPSPRRGSGSSAGSTRAGSWPS